MNEDIFLSSRAQSRALYPVVIEIRFLHALRLVGMTW